MNILPVSYVDSYNNIFAKLEESDYSGVPKGSKISISWSIKYLSGNFESFNTIKAQKRIKDFLTERIKKIYNDKKIHLEIKIDIVQGSINFNFYISLEVLEKMDYTRFKIIIGTIILGIAMLSASPIIVQWMQNNNNTQLQQIQNDNNIQLQQMQNDNAIQLQQMENDNAIKIKQMENDNTQKDREVLVSIFNNERLNLSGNDVSKIMTGYFDKTVNRSINFISQSPVKEMFKKIPDEELELSELTTVVNVPGQQEQTNIDNTSEDNGISPNM